MKWCWKPTVVTVIQDKVGNLKKESVFSSAVNIILGDWYQHITCKGFPAVSLDYIAGKKEVWAW